MSANAIDVTHLSFSYEVAQNINSQVVKRLAVEDERPAPPAPSQRTTHDGGLSVTMPRRQYEANEEIVYKVQLRDVNLALPQGARCLLVGSNGSGKSTLLNILGGKHMVNVGDVRVLSRQCFTDTALTNEVALLTGNWTRTVAFVGHGVPYQAMEVATLIDTHAEGIDAERVERLCALLGVRRSWNLTAASDGQRRRVQILLKLLRPFRVLLLDEITTDLDLLVRQELLQWLREECEERGVTVVYCTHIFDGLDGWATHVAHIEQTRVLRSAAAEDVPELHAVPLAGAAAGAPAPAAAGRLFGAVRGWLLEARPDFISLLEPADAATAGAVAAASVPVEAGVGAVEVRELRWGYPAAPGAAQRRLALDGASVSVARGERVLLTGANGAGKSTLLRVLGGKHLVTSGSVRVLGKDAFADVTTLNTTVALLTGDWSRTVACVGSGVPYQADFSADFMATNALTALKAEGTYAEAALDARLARLRHALDIDGEWRMNAVSDGQRRRIQILLKLLRPAAVVLMDEVTTDLDVLARQSLLAFLKEECEVRGVTVVYATHILDGLDGWPTKLLHVRDGLVAHYGSVEAFGAIHAPASEGARAAESGSLYRSVRAALKAEIVEDAEQLKAAAAVADVGCTPATADSAPSAKPVASAAPSLTGAFGGSRFDRFGSASGRQMNMYG